MFGVFGIGIELLSEANEVVTSKVVQVLDRA